MQCESMCFHYHTWPQGENSKKEMMKRESWLQSNKNTGKPKSGPVVNIIMFKLWTKPQDWSTVRQIVTWEIAGLCMDKKYALG